MVEKIDEATLKELANNRKTKVYNRLRVEQETDEKYYELAFGEKVPLPKEPKARLVIPNTARELVDLPRASLLSGKVKANQPPRSGKKDYIIMSAKVEAWLNAWITMLMKEDPSPIEEGLNFLLLRGEVFWKTVYDDKAWRLDKFRGESDEDFSERQAIHKLNNFPLRLEAVDPIVCFPAPSRKERLVPADMLEVYSRTVGDIRETWGEDELVSLEGKKDDDEVEWMEYSSPLQYICMADGKPFINHDNHYGFVPYSHAYAGLGVRSTKGEVEKLARSIIFPYRDLLALQSRVLSQIESIIDWFTWPMAKGKNLPEDFSEKVKIEPGGFINLTQNQEFDMEKGVAPSPELFAFYHLITGVIEGGGRQPALRGEAVGRSGLQLETAIGQAGKRSEKVRTNFENSLAVALGQGLMLLENVIGEPVGLKTMEIKDGGIVVGETALKPTDIQKYYVVNVALDPEDEEKAVRRKALGRDLRSGGSISWKRELTQYHGMTNSEADEEITRRLAEDVIMTTPQIKEALGVSAAEQLGLLTEIEKVQAATGEERRSQEGLSKRTGALPMEGQPAYPAPGPSPYAYASREIEKGM